MNNRKQSNIVIFGGNGCGKTTFMLDFIMQYLEYNQWKRVLILTPDDSEEKLDFVPEIEEEEFRDFKGLKKHITASPKIFKTISETYLPHAKKDRESNIKVNGMIIVDDAGVILTRRDEDVLNFFRRRRQANCDLVTIFHGLRNEVPPSFFAYVTDLVIFQTADNPKKLVDLLPPAKQDEFLEVYNRVQEKAITDPHYHEQLKLR